MAKGTLSYGFKSALDRPGLAGLLYGFHLIMAVIITIPLYLTIASTVGLTGFSEQLSAEFDIALWMDIFEESLPVFQAFQIQLLWIIPLFLLWKVASSVGIIHTLHTQGLRGFWHGVGEHSGRAILLGLVFLVPLIFLAVGIAVFIVVLTVIWSGEVAAFWNFGVILPVTVILGMALLDLMHDYARMNLVIARKPVMESMISGFMWPFRHGRSILIYAAWFIPAAIILVLPTIIDVKPGGLWGVFIVQQILLFVRSAMTVGWFGSEVSFFDQTVTNELPLIAEDASELGQTFADSGAPGESGASLEFAG